MESDTEADTDGAEAGADGTEAETKEQAEAMSALIKKNPKLTQDKPSLELSIPLRTAKRIMNKR